jgi:preprotein translocase subunit SecE
MAKKQNQVGEANTEKAPSPVTRLVRYLEDARGELRKITWPTLKETRRATFAVLGFVAVMAVILGLVDLALSSLIKAILS